MASASEETIPTATLVERFLGEVWNGRQLDVIDELFASDYELHNLSDDSVSQRGRAQLRDHIDGWLAAFPDLQMVETDRLVDDARVVSVMRARGHHTGAEFHGIAAGGASVDVVLVAIFEGDGKSLTRHGTLLDARGLLAQLAPAVP